jgi:iron complex outermembrane receptor protein
MKTLLMAAATAAVVQAAEVQPAETNEVVDLPPVTVYASRIDDSREMMPARVDVFDAKAIAASGARDLPELLRKSANIEVRKLNANPLQSQISMRGFGENSFGRVKVLVDGEELNYVDMEAPNLARIPLGNVERVEIIHGPSPVLHGDGAVAGVVNVMTDAKDYEKKTRITGKAGSQYTFGANAQTKGGFEDELVQYSAAYDYTMSDGYRDHSAYDMHTAGAKVRQNFENGSYLGVKANYYNAYYEMPGSLSHDAWKHARKSAVNHDDWARVWNYGAGIDSKILLAEDQWLFLDGDFSQKHRKVKWGASGYANEYDLYSFFVSPRYVNEKAVFGFDNKFTFGFDFRHDLYKVLDDSGYNNHRYHFTRTRGAVFAQDEFFLTDSLSIVAGARLETIANRWSGYRGLSEDGNEDWMGDYELGLVFRPIEGLRAYVKGTRFHRSAFCDELNYTEDGRFLDPETGTSLDIGVEYVFLEEFKLELNGYGSIMEDEIFYNPYARDYGEYWGGYNANSPSKTRRIGFDSGFSWRREGVAEAAVKYGLVQADFGKGQYHGEEVPLVPNHRIRAEAGVWLFGDLEIKGGFRYVSAQWLSGDYANEHDELPAYTLFDVGLYYDPSWAKGWRATFVMDNLFDRNYCDFAGWSNYSYYYPACGRSFMFTLSYEF